MTSMEDLLSASPSKRMARLQTLPRSSLQRIAKENGVKVLLLDD